GLRIAAAVHFPHAARAGALFDLEPAVQHVAWSHRATLSRVRPAVRAETTGHSSYLSKNFGLMALNERRPISGSLSSCSGRSTMPSRAVLGLSALSPIESSTS